MSPEYGADYYAGRNMDKGQDVHVPRTLAKIARVHELLREHRVLEIGCGFGVISRALAAMVARVTALDVSEHAVTVARKAGVPSNVTFVVSDALAFSTRESFDVVIALSVFEHLDAGERRAFLTRAASWLAPGGRLVLHVPITRSASADRRKRRLKNPGIDYTGDPTHRTRFSIRSLRRSLRHGSFRVDRDWIRYSRWGLPEGWSLAALRLLPAALRHKFAMEAMVAAVPDQPRST